MSERDSESWHEPLTYSVWVYRPDLGEVNDGEDPAPIVFLVLFEWEIAGLHGVHLVEVYGSLFDLMKPEEQRSCEYDRLDKELCDADHLRGRYIAELIDQGHLQRLGTMPKWGEFSKPPEHLLSLAQRQAAASPIPAPTSATPVDSHP